MDYDNILIDCPNCEKQVVFSTRAGTPLSRSHDLDSAPLEQQADFFASCDRGEVVCPHCEHRIRASPPEVSYELYAERPGHYTYSEARQKVATDISKRDNIRPFSVGVDDITRELQRQLWNKVFGGIE